MLKSYFVGHKKKIQKNLHPPNKKHGLGQVGMKIDTFRQISLDGELVPSSAIDNCGIECFFILFFKIIPFQGGDFLLAHQSVCVCVCLFCFVLFYFLLVETFPSFDVFSQFPPPAATGSHHAQRFATPRNSFCCLISTQ